ncbi:MAG TPA: hypothetical protein VN659_10020 [Pyrinomonadaceae bacterium]|nr:hypothetical protein [Pyrinomonadaceae bacterium]
MKCRNCERDVPQTRARCPACRTKMPAWYLMAAIGSLVALIVAFKIVEAIL